MAQGAPDGVGGALKNLANQIVSYGTSIPDAESLYEQLESNFSVAPQGVIGENPSKLRIGAPTPESSSWDDENPPSEST